MSAGTAPQHRVPHKWRPSLAMIVFAVLATVLALPLVSLFFLRLYENQLIRQAEGELVAQSVALAALAAVATVVVMTLVIGFLFWRTITRPMRDLVRYTEMVGSGNRDAPPLPDHHGTRELATLSRSFVDMATRLHERTDYITTFAAHVSHELKSPLSAIRGAAELLRDSGAEMSPDEQRRFLENILADTERLTALVARLRELARADNPRIGETPLDPVVAAVRAAHPALSVAASGALDQPVRISAENAGIVLSHLADNASRHHARSLEIVARAAGERIQITVRNDGDPIADNNREKIFTPFFTTRRDSGGTGMGLEIVRSMLRAHGGGIRLVAVHPVTFEIDVPRA